MKKNIGLSILMVGISLSTFSQSESSPNPIHTQVPFLNSYPDARGVGLGNTGVATSPDAASVFWNPAKLAFIKQNAYGDIGGLFSFDPGYVDLEKRFNGYASVFKSLGKQTIAASFKYYSAGELLLSDEEGMIITEARPIDFSIDLAFAHRFNPNFSGGFALRYIRSNLFGNKLDEIKNVVGDRYQVGQSVAADIALFYQKDLSISGINRCYINYGLSISNIGAKMTYDKEGDYKWFLPTNLRLGTSINVEQDIHKASISFDLNKLLVPTPPVYGYNDFGQLYIKEGKDPEVSVPRGMLQSFYDAPDGFSEELIEFYFGVGLEYWYNNLLAFRTGFYSENEYKGNKKYLGLGAGVKFSFFQFDVTYSFDVKEYTSEFTKEFTTDCWFASLTLFFDSSPIAEE